MSPLGTTGNTRSLSYWIDTVPPTSVPKLDGDAQAEVVIVGQGIAGITAAYLLAKAGKSVVVLDADHPALAETGHTTAHLQIVIDTPLSILVPRFGLDATRLAWDSQREAADLIGTIARERHISCELERLDAFLYSPHEKDRAMLKEERRLALKMGYACEWAKRGDIPFPTAVGLRYPEQGKFHVRKYLLGLIEAARKLGAKFYGGARVVEVESGATILAKTADGHSVKGEWLLCCTNTPIVGRETIHTKLMPYRTYVVGARVPKGAIPNHLYWDTLDPYHYTRVEQKSDHDLVILGGEDHRVGGLEATQECWGRLWQHLRETVAEFTPAYQWSGEILETMDDLPYIGAIPGRGENELMVTGDSGTGMTNGTIGALMLAERVLGRGTPWDELYDPKRVMADTVPLKEWAKHNLRAGGSLVHGALQRPEIKDLAELRYGEGAIMKQGLKPIAVARLDDGTIAAVSAACTHVGCAVKWNSGERSWDCPCHGSRFSPSGEVLHGPAVKPLAPVDLDALVEAREEEATGS